MDWHEWLPTIAVLFGLAVNLVGLGVLWGRSSEVQRAQTQAIEKVTDRLDGLDSFRTDSTTDRRAINVRLGHVEEAMQALPQIHDRLTRIEESGRHETEAIERLARSVENVQRQVANIVTGGSDRVLEITPARNRRRRSDP